MQSDFLAQAKQGVLIGANAGCNCFLDRFLAAVKRSKVGAACMGGEPAGYLMLSQSMTVVISVWVLVTMRIAMRPESGRTNGSDL